MKEQYAKGELAKDVLMAFAAGGLAVTCIALPGMAHVVKLFEPKDVAERKRLARCFRNLRKQGYVMRQVRNGQEVFVATRKGRQQIRDYLAGDLHIKKPVKWDKKWRVVMFDIPNTKRRVRQEISFRIKDIGMYAIQNSVFVSPFPCKAEIDFLTAHFKVEKYFVYLEATTIESKEDLVNLFELRK